MRAGLAKKVMLLIALADECLVKTSNGFLVSNTNN